MSQVNVIVIHVRADQAKEYEKLFTERELPRWKDYQARGKFVSARFFLLCDSMGLPRLPALPTTAKNAPEISGGKPTDDRGRPPPGPGAKVKREKVGVHNNGHPAAKKMGAPRLAVVAGQDHSRASIG